MTNVAKMVKKRRKELSISQGKLGRSLGFENGQFISNIENSNIQYPAIYFKKISKYLRLNLDSMIEKAIDDYGDWLFEEIQKGKH